MDVRPRDPAAVLAREPAWSSPPSYFPQFQEGPQVCAIYSSSIHKCLVGFNSHPAELEALGNVPERQETNKRALWKVSGSIETSSKLLKRAQDAE